MNTSFIAKKIESTHVREEYFPHLNETESESPSHSDQSVINFEDRDGLPSRRYREFEQKNQRFGNEASHGPGAVENTLSDKSVQGEQLFPRCSLRSSCVAELGSESRKTFSSRAAYSVFRRREHFFKATVPRTAVSYVSPCRIVGDSGRRARSSAMRSSVNPFWLPLSLTLFLLFSQIFCSSDYINSI